jgi:serine/threonine protein kinase
MSTGKAAELPGLPDKYAEIVELKPGKNGLVWKATNTNLNRPVFLKAYPIPSGDLESALHEPKLLQELAHTNLAKIFDADQLDNGERLLLEMELVDGESLDNRIKGAAAKGSWPAVHELLETVRQIANGVACMHLRGIVHRDLKPANVMLRRRGSKHEAVVVDLGLASRLSAAGRAVASKHAFLYRPPEVWQGKGYSRASDVYQIGIILFQLLGGEIDYGLGDLSEETVGRAICAGKLLNWTGFAPYLSHSLRRLLESCLGIEANRPRDASELSVALHNSKKKQGNWAYQKTEDGFALEQDVKGGVDRVTVRVGLDGTQTAERHRRVRADFRREGSAVILKHRDLARCRQFQQVLAKRRA